MEFPRKIYMEAGQLIYVAVPYTNEDDVLLYQIQESAMTYARPFVGNLDGGITGYNIRFKYTDVDMNRRRRYNCAIYNGRENQPPYTDDFERQRCLWGGKSEYGLLFFDDDKERLTAFVKDLLRKEMRHASIVIEEIKNKLKTLEEQLECEKSLERPSF